MQRTLDLGLRMPVVSGEMYTEQLQQSCELREAARQLNSAHNVVHPQVRQLHKRFLPTGPSAAGVQRYHGTSQDWKEGVVTALFNQEDSDRVGSIVDAFWSSHVARVRCILN